ncbi:hypothetical protein NYE69_27210 [Paenibacillus sp. FSL R5-0527]|uniref:hypothetical protein n=1 Tax=Paenibacillus sp. FSL R5-0527 TaxID=2975321 RepID=UPI0026BE95CD
MSKRTKPKPSGLKPGNQVVMHSCYEARKEKYAGKVWTVDSEPWDLCGSEVVRLKGYNGGFATEFLKKWEPKPCEFEVIKDVYWDDWGHLRKVFRKGDVCKGKLWPDGHVSAESPYYPGISDSVESECIVILGEGSQL